jgi:hypothetical protein
MPKQDLTAIAFVLDKSGSMHVVRDATISGFNEFLADQKRVPGDVLFSLTLFDTAMQQRFVNEPIHRVEPLTVATYEPGGGTALLDAVASTINEIGRRFDAMPGDQKPGKVLFVIQTDGQENASREFSAQRVRDLIKQQTDQWQWQFLFLGADQDAWAQGALLGIARSNSLSYGNDAIGTRSAFATVASVATSYRVSEQGVAATLGPNGLDLRKKDKGKPAPQPVTP